MLRVTITYMREDRADHTFYVDDTDFIKVTGMGLYVPGGPAFVTTTDGQRLFGDGDEVAMVTVESATFENWLLWVEGKDGK